MAENKLDTIVVSGVEYDIGFSNSQDLAEFPISKETIITDTEEIIIGASETEPTVIITKDFIKVKKITDFDGNEIISNECNSEYKIDQEYVYQPVYCSSDFSDWYDYDSDSRGGWTKGVNGITPTTIGGYVSNRLCGAIYLPNIYRAQYKMCRFDVVLYTDNILNIHFCRSIQTAQTPNESMYKIDCINKKLIMTKLNGRQVTDTVLKEEPILFDIVDGDTYSVNIEKKDLYFSMELINKFGDNVKIEWDGDWQGGTQLQSYGFSLGAGSTSLTITNFRVYLPCNVNAIIVGDSITEGSGMINNEDYRWSNRLAKAIGNSLVSGASSGTLQDITNINYWNKEILMVKPKYFIMMMGTNNADISENYSKTLKTIYEQIVNNCELNNIIPIILHIPSFNSYTNNVLIINQEIIDTLGVDTGKTDIATSINNIPSNGCNMSMFTDGCHPNKMGSIAIIERFKLDLPFLFNHTI